MRPVGLERRFAVELGVNHDIDVVAELNLPATIQPAVVSRMTSSGAMENAQ